MKLHEKLRKEAKKNAEVASWPIILLGFILTSTITYYVAKKSKAEDELRFHYETNGLIRRIQNRMSQYEGALIQTRAFLNNVDNVHRSQIQKYFLDTEIFKRYPGLQGMGYSVLIQKKDLPAHMRIMWKELPDYKIWPQYDREVYSSIIALEPNDWRNARAIGFDMYQEPVRHKAMALASDKNTAVMTEKIVLVQERENEKLPGFNIYLPIYRKNSDISTVENRRKNLIAYIYSPFRSEELFKAIFSDFDVHVDIEIFDGRAPVEGKLLYNYDKKFGNVNFNMKLDTTIKLLERDLYFRFTPLPHFDPSYSHLRNFSVMIMGALVTYILFLIYLVGRRQLRLARIVAQEKEKLLAKEKEHVSARDDFLSIASHELKTPLTSLKLQAQVMKRAIDRKDPTVFSPEKVTHLIQQIDNQTTRLTRLVDDMLDISRIRTGRLKMLKDNVELTEIVKDVVERLSPQFMATIGQLPVVKCDQEIQGFWDRFRLEQVFMNLLTNAIRYGRNKPIEVRVEKVNGMAHVCVIDQGIGIAPENIQKIFDRFERAGMSASEVSGMGLGFYITNQIVKAHGGSIHVKSEPDKGSTFTVVLPLS